MQIPKNEHLKYDPMLIDTTSLLQLPFYDPQRWGWAATGGIFDLLTPLEVCSFK